MEGTRTGHEKLADQLKKTHVCEHGFYSGDRIEIFQDDGCKWLLEGNRWTLKVTGSSHGKLIQLPINFCPFCGEKL